MKYFINENNFINYEIVNDFVMVRSIFYDDFSFLSQHIFAYIDFFANIENVNFLGGYPGTFNPLVVRYVLDYLKNKNFNYRIFYDKQEVKDIQRFERVILESRVQQSLLVDSPSVLQSACNGYVGQALEKSGFKRCCVFSPLKINYDYVKTPIKYYEIDSQGYLIAEYDEKPSRGGRYYQSYRLKPMFDTGVIRIENGKPVYHGNK
jgi:hypothetical protein